MAFVVYCHAPENYSYKMSDVQTSVRTIPMDTAKLIIFLQIPKSPPQIPPKNFNLKRFAVDEEVAVVEVAEDGAAGGAVA